MRPIVLLIVLIIFLVSGQKALAQKYYNKEESKLTQKKWVVLKKKGKSEYFETGEEFSFDVDRRFIYKRHNFDIISGKWALNGNQFILVIDSHPDMDMNDRKKIPQEFKVIKLKKDEMVLKYELDKKGKIVLI
jgi:hypothetical protein